MPKPYWMVPFPEKNFRDRICLSPLVSVNIGLHGTVGLCACGGWQPSHVGNILEESLGKILSNAQSTAIRTSIVDGTYKYCNANTCGVIKNNQLLPADHVPDSVKPILTQPARYILPNEITLALDQTCNLSCPSCRTSVIKVDDDFIDYQTRIGRRIAENIFDSASDNELNLVLSTTGELFASPLLLEFVRNVPVDRYTGARLSIQTNGLLAPSRWNKLGIMQDRVKQITVTVDAASQKTYEILRRGGKWQNITDSLRWISSHCQQNQIQFNCRMVVQTLNFAEIQQFYDMCDNLSADRIEYTRLTDWGTYPKAEFLQHDVFNPKHLAHAMAKQELEKIRSLPKTWISGDIV